MSSGEEIKDVNKSIDKVEDAVKKYASKDTVISIGGYEFTPAKLMALFAVLSTAIGGLYTAFETYKSFQTMQKKIDAYVSPDLSEFDKRLTLVEETSTKTNDYTRDIKNDLKNDIRKLEKIVEQIERDGKTLNREVDRDLRALRKEYDEKIKKALSNPLAD